MFGSSSTTRTRGWLGAACVTFFSSPRHARSMWFSSNQLDTEEQSMTNRIRQFALAAGSALMALGMVAGVFAATQNQNTSNPGAPFSHGRMGPPGGMFGMPFGPMGLAGPIA